MPEMSSNFNEGEYDMNHPKGCDEIVPTRLLRHLSREALAKIEWAREDNDGCRGALVASHLIVWAQWTYQEATHFLELTGIAIDYGELDFFLESALYEKEIKNK
jgi:hypothetical protein